MSQSPAYIKALEGFRGVCILLVLLHNLFPYQLETPGVFGKALREVAGSGWVGVQWFFVLSGFLITRILLSAPSTLDSVKSFYVRRSLRIFPIYYFVLLILLIIVPLMGFTFPGTHSAIEHSAWFWTYSSNLIGLCGIQDIGLSHFWSLAVEEQFYLVWPWLILFLSNQSMKKICLALIVSAVLIRVFILWWAPNQADQLNYVLTFVRWDALALGALLALMMHQTVNVKKVNRYLFIVMPVIFLWLFLILIYFRDFKAVGSGILVMNQTLAALIGGSVILMLTVNKDIVGRLLNRIFTNGIFCHLGKYSYAIYVFHLIVAAGVYHFRQDAADVLRNYMDLAGIEICLLVITLGAIYLLARLSWIFIESPFLKIKQQFA